jgi:serine/threonine protein kinase/tetratricopeptide (TPR) repeat protein
MELKSEDWPQVKDRFQALLEMPAAAREGYLASDDLPDDLRYALKELLSAHSDAGSFLSSRQAMLNLPEPAPHNPLGAGAIPCDAVLSDRFRILRFIAKGGMGEVYEAEDLELGQRVALKTIRPEIAEYPGALSRFKREVNLARQVTHPNVCRIFDLFRHHPASGADTVFLTMELLHGQTLSERLSGSGHLPSDEALSLLRQVASALDAAHRAGVLHRDLKPGNIVLDPEARGQTRAVITDFGMAWSGAGGSEFQLTGSSQLLLGTPEYMSPEQIEGKTLTAASDIYSLGLVAYQMVTGARAFAADTPLYSALRRLTEQPLPPSRIQPGLDRRWDAILSRCLNRDPARRFSSAGELTEALEGNVLAPLPRADLLVHHLARLSRRFRAHRQLLLVGILSVAALAIGLVVWKHLRPVPLPTDNLTVVVASFINTTGEPIFDDTLQLALTTKLQQSPFLTLMPETSIRQQLRSMGMPEGQRLTESIAREVCLRGNGHVFIQGAIARTAKGYTVGVKVFECRSNSLIAEGELPVDGFRGSVLDALDQATDAIRPKLGESRESIRRFDVPLGDATTASLEALAAFAPASTWTEPGPSAIEHCLRAIELDPNFALAYARLGTLYGNSGETERAEKALRNAYDRRDRVTEWERFYIVSHYYGFVTGQIDKEKETYQQWAQIYPHDMAWAINLGVDYATTADFDKAIDLDRRVIQEIPGLAPSYANLAQYYLAIDHPDEARSILDQAARLKLRDQNLDLDRYQLAFYAKDSAALAQMVSTAQQAPNAGAALLALHAATEDLHGRAASGAGFTQRAAQAAIQSGDTESGGTWLAAEAVRQAELGSSASARALLTRALNLKNVAKSHDLRILAAIASAIEGDQPHAKASLAALTRDYPLDTLIQSYWAPLVRARIAFSAGQYEQALRSLDGTDVYDLGISSPGQCMDAAYLRGQVLLAAHQGQAAAAQFRAVLAHRGLVLNCPTFALSQLGLARALASTDQVASRHAYQDLFALWKDADSNLVPLAQAKSEYSALR